MDIQIKVKYMGILWDNYQGGSGKVFKKSIIMNLDDKTTLEDTFRQVHYMLKKEQNQTFVGEIRVLDVKLMEIKNADQ